MQWIQAFLTLIVLLIGFAPSKAEAAEERPRPIDGAPADTACGVIHAGLPGADSHRMSTPPVDLSVAFDSLIQASPLLADTSSVGLSAPLEKSLVPVQPLLIETPPVAVTHQHRCPTGWPATAVRRLTWLQRFLF